MLTLAAPLAAQQPDSSRLAPVDSALDRNGYRNHRGHLRWYRGDHSRMEAGRGNPYEPARLLAHKDALGLSSQQVAQLTALESGAKPGVTADVQQMRTERAAIASALRSDAPDTVELKRHYAALQTAAGNAHWARVNASLKARAVLTAAQRSQVGSWAARRAGRAGRWHSRGR